MMGRIAIAAGFAGVVGAAIVSIHVTAAVPRSASVRGALQPVMSVITSKIGGTIREVYVKQDEQLLKGRTLVRFDRSDLKAQRHRLEEALQTGERAIETSEVAARIPDRVRSYLYQTHPDVREAESEYVRALAAFEKSPAAKARLERAEQGRVRVRQQVRQLFGNPHPGSELEELVTSIRKTMADLDELLQEEDIQAPEDCKVDILDLKPGDEILPGHPLAVLAVTGQYFSDLAVSELVAARLRPGMLLKATLIDSRGSIDWRVDSISSHPIPMVLRDRGGASVQYTVRARLSSSAVLPAGTVARFELP